MLGRALNAILMFAVYFSAATAAAQAVGVAVLYARGALRPEKLTQYAAVLYGVELPAPAPASGETPPKDEQDESLPRPERLAMAAQRSPLLQNRAAATAREIAAVADRQRDLQTRTQRYTYVQKSLDDLLSQLAAEAEGSAVLAVQETLGVLPPAQAKDLLLDMLNDAEIPPQEALKEVSDLLTAMGPDRIKKILAEFKTDEERVSLHRILASIGKLAPVTTEGQGT
jgi:hypothetical protein